MLIFYKELKLDLKIRSFVYFDHGVWTGHVPHGQPDQTIDIMKTRDPIFKFSTMKALINYNHRLNIYSYSIPSPWSGCDTRSIFKQFNRFELRVFLLELLPYQS